ncbi:hypothetical protein KJ359_007679 [Pestalotiopsis sp. 9143b]|nr:hypothetical protein KJ359_007679 [Pestalotiopsis sp. 9143b]
MTLRLPRYGRLQQENPKLIEKYEDSIRHNGDLGTALASILVVGPMKREQMEYVLMRKMEQVNRDAWKLKFGDSTDVEVKDIVEPVLKVVDKANDFITNALDGNPQASIAWAGVSLSLPLLLNPSKQAASLAKGLEYISRLIVQNQLREDLYVRYEKQPADDEVWKRSHKTFKDHLEKLYRQILCLQAEAYCYYSSNSALRIVRDMARWDDWEALLIRVQEQEQAFLGVNELFKDGKYREECEAAERRHRETEGTWKSIGADLSNLHKAIEDARSDKDRVELLNWLCKVDHSKLFNAARDRHQDGTNKWLIKDNDTFKQWEKRPHSFLWLHGKAGSGKSIISSSVIEYIDERIDSETALVYFFFSFTDPANQGTDIIANGQGDVIDLHNGVHRQVLDHDIGSYIESTLQSPDFEHFTTETKKKVQDRLVENADGM